MTWPVAEYVAAAGQREFDVPFPFISRTHVEVLVNGLLVPILEWAGPARVRLASPLRAGDSVVIRRNTPIEQQLVRFQDGAVLTGEDLNLAVQQLLFKQQELDALYQGSLRQARIRLAENLGIVTDPEAVAQELAELVLEQEVLDTFRRRIADIDLNAQAILDQAFRTEALNQALTGVDQARQQLGSRVDALRRDHDSLVDLVDALAGGDPGSGIATMIENERVERIEGDAALAQTLSLIGARSGDGRAFILDLDTTRVSPSESLAQRLFALSAADADARALILAEQSARVDAVAAQAQRIDGLTARMGSAEAAVLAEQQARSTADEALAESVQSLQGRVGSNEASIASVAQARADGDSALSSRIDALVTRVGGAEASLVAEQQARASGDSALASTLALLGAGNANGTAFVLDLDKALVGPSESLAQRFSALSAEDGSNKALIQSETTARVNADNALSGRIDSLGTRIGTAESAIVAEQNTRASEDSALAGQINALAARLGSAEAAIQSEAVARANQDSVFAGYFQLLGARNGSGTAWVLDDSKVQLSGGVSLGARLSGIDTRLGGNEAAIVSEANARAAGDGALADQISVVNTSVNGLSASVSALAQSLDGVQARYGVSLDVNGYVTGFVQNNDGRSGSFTILADRFAVVAPGVAPFVPFEVSGGVVRMKEAVIGSLQVDKLTNGTLWANIGLNGDIQVGTGKIIWDNGSYMKVTGVGFGTNNQFLEWFGPKMPIHQCSEANAIQYLKTDGSAYFGGSLSAGILKNAAQSSSPSPYAEIEVGPFGSNGGPRVITVSLTYSQTAYITNGASWSGSSYADIVLEKRAGTGWETIATTRAHGEVVDWNNGFGQYELGYITETISGSLTFTDTSGGLQGHYRARLTGRTTFTIHSQTHGIPSQGQRLGIVCTEE